PPLVQPPLDPRAAAPGPRAAAHGPCSSRPSSSRPWTQSSRPWPLKQPPLVQPPLDPEQLPLVQPPLNPATPPLDPVQPPAERRPCSPDERLLYPTLVSTCLVSTLPRHLPACQPACLPACLSACLPACLPLGASGGGLLQLQLRPRKTLTSQQLHEWYAHSRGSLSTVRCPYIIRTGDRTGQTCGTISHTQSRCFARLSDAWRTKFGDEAELPDWVELLGQRVDIFSLDYAAILTAMYALSVSAEGDCYLCVPPDLRITPGIAPAALGACESAPLGTAPAQALHTFTLDSGASRCFFRDSTTVTPLPAPVPVSLADPSGDPVLARSSTVLPCPAVPFGELSGLHLPSFSTNLVSNAVLLDAGVDTFTPGRQRVAICTCSQSGRHLATFARAPGSSLYTLTTASHSTPFVSPVARVCSGSYTVSLPPLPPLPAPPCIPCVEGRQRAAPHSSSFPPTEAPLQTLHLDVWGPARVRGQGHERYFLLVVDDYTRYTTVFPLQRKGDVPDVLIPWIRATRLQLRERFQSDFPVLRLHSDRGGEFSSDLLAAFCAEHGIRQTFTLPASSQQNGVAERRIGLVMEVARTSMIHAAAPHFLWPFAVWYAAHQLNHWPRVSLPETSPALPWTGKVLCDAIICIHQGGSWNLCLGAEEMGQGSGDAAEKRNEPPPSKIEALDGSNYEEWSGRMRSAFKCYKLLKLAMGEEKMPEEGDARDRWIEKSTVLYDLILQSVNNDMFQHIKDLPNTLPMVIVLEKELAALSMRPGDDVKPVHEKIKDTYARMAAAGSNVSHMQQCTKIISVLDNSWDNLIPTLNTQQDQWTPEWLRQQILQEDFRRRHTGGGAANKTAEGYGAAGGSRGRGGGRGRGRGRGFGRRRGRGDYNEGHGSSGGRGSTRMEGACWYCKKAGHPWFKCFSRPEGWAPPGMKPPSGERARGGAVQGSGAQGDGAQGKANPGMFLMVEDVKGSEGDVGSVGKVLMHPLTHWVIDSGCTSHMTPRADLLDEVKPPGKIKFVAAASGALLPVIGVGNAKKSKAKVTFGPTSCRAKLGKLLLWDLEEKSSCIKDLWQLPIIPWNGKPPATAAAAATAKTTAGGEETAPTDGALDAVKKVQQSQQSHGEVLAGVDATAAWAKASSVNGDADWETWHERLCHINIPMLQKLVKDGSLKGLE
ncbi:unnamed protein product, partial [Closterium sp. NIES-54]